MGFEIKKQLSCRVRRTYRGGKLLDEFLGNDTPTDSFMPEDWISSFIEAKNKDYIEGEGLSYAEVDGGSAPLRQLVGSEEFGEGRAESGVLIKLLDAGERLGIQVHPTKEYARRIFNSQYGKTECWYILGCREDPENPPCVYLGFKENVTREMWQRLFEEQDVRGMLASMHKFEVCPGDCILVCGGVPHAIGAGCFLLEIQEPSDYTMRAETTTVAGEVLTPMQIHYGVGVDNMLDCFSYDGFTKEEMKEKFFPRSSVGEDGIRRIVTYQNTDCFALDEVISGVVEIKKSHFLTVVVKKSGGTLECGEKKIELQRADRFFIPADTAFTLRDANVILCYPPKK